MSVVIDDELQELFNLRDHRAATIEKFIIAEAVLQANMQQNSSKEFIEVHELDIAYKLLKPVLYLKEELEKINLEFDKKKKFFITLLESSGCNKLFCSNKEFNSAGHYEYINYTLSLAKNIDGDDDLVIHPTSMQTKFEA